MAGLVRKGTALPPAAETRTTWWPLVAVAPLAVGGVRSPNWATKAVPSGANAALRVKSRPTAVECRGKVAEGMRARAGGFSRTGCGLECVSGLTRGSVMGIPATKSGQPYQPPWTTWYRLSGPPDGRWPASSGPCSVTYSVPSDVKARP